MPHRMIPHDTALIDRGVEVTLGVGSQKQKWTVEFQFPPKIKEDGRGGSWKEESTGPNAGDPLVYYEHGEPRKISMEWTYVVGAGPGWHAGRIWNQLTWLRYYFMNSQQSADNQENSIFASLVVGLRIWGLAGKNRMSFRLQSAAMKHSDTLVGVGEKAFPLRTDVSVQLRSWPKILTVQFAPGQIETPNDWY